ncbi:MAG TPA: CocE/NonD family hydrolase [Baekduia sp.]|uniref:CocE/NonD family hydrolase n=1 Tax=Baekduia sp. TaxID=2600305 RepID=UPI002D768811|nr:CocE/NonD family hydrolase [Baekduia sp.]HET6507286.1 CocE/NonD family hydrolase [Baekduia sp.]
MSRVRATLAVALTAAFAPAAAAHAQDATVTSFDGTAITIHVFPSPAGGAAPTVLNGPGWSQSGDTDPTKGVIKELNDDGYNVVTWDPRGFGTSGGVVSIDTPSIEGRDTSAIVDWVAQQPWSLNDGPGDPRVGMAGGSYGGGIQYSTAIADHRLDALVPVVGWHSLRTSLYKDDTFKQGWDTLLYGSGLGAANAVPPGLDPHITSAYEQGSKTGVLSSADAAWFAARGPGDAVSKITTPTMVVGGTVDTLFPLDEDIKLYNAIKNGPGHAPVKMVWFCGGHGTCLTGTGDPGGAAPTLALGSQHLTDLTAAWFAKYLKKDASANTGPGFEWLADDAKWRSAPAWPAKAAGSIAVSGKGRLKLVKGTQSGDKTGVAATPAPASASLQIAFRTPRAAQLVGAPRLTLSYSGKGTPAKGAKVFAQIVDVKRKLVVGNQVTPIPLVLDGRKHTVTRDLDPIAAAAAKGARYTLQIISGSTVWAPQRGTGTVTVARARLVLPTVKG